MKILITGGSGFIGSYLVEQLLKNPQNEITILDLVLPKTKDKRVQAIQGDASDAKQMRSLLFNTDIVYHLAALVSVPLCEMRPQENYHHNVLTTLNICKLICDINPKIKLVFSSSAAVYGDAGQDQNAISETQSEKAVLISNYAKHKLESEKIITEYVINNNLRAVIFRFFNVFGKGQNPDSPYTGVITQFINRIQKSKDLDVFNSGNNTRDFVDVRFIVEVLVHLLSWDIKNYNAGPINIGSGHSMKIIELANKMITLSKKSLKINLLPSRLGDIQHSKSDVEKLKKITGESVFNQWNQKYNLSSYLPTAINEPTPTS